MTEYHHFIINHWTDDLKQQSVEMSMVNLVTFFLLQFLKRSEAFEVQFCQDSISTLYQRHG